MDDVVSILEECGIDASVLDEYDCFPVRARPVGGVVKLRTSTGVRALKRVLLPTVKMRFIHSAQEYVAQRGLYPVPRFIRNRYGDPFIVHHTGIYYMTAWLPGRSPDFRKPSSFQIGARTLGSWHSAAGGFQYPADPALSVPGVERRIDVMYRDFAEAAKVAADADVKTPFMRLVLESKGEIEERYGAAQEMLRTRGIEQAQADARSGGALCHGSFQKQHVLTNGEETTVLHYESVHAGLPITDLALFCHRYMPAFEWNEEVLRAAVEAYGSGAGSVSHLDLLAALLSVPLRSLQVISWYFRGSKEWDEDDFLDYLEASLFMEEHREEALRSVSSKSQNLPALRSGEGMEPGSAGDWSVATFRLSEDDEEESINHELVNGTLEAREYATDEPSDIAVEMADDDLEDDDSTEVVPMKISKDSDGILVVKPPRRRKERRSTHSRASQKQDRTFLPEAPGLRLWGPNEHRSKDNEQKKKDNQVQRGGPENSTQKE